MSSRQDLPDAENWQDLLFDVDVAVRLRATEYIRQLAIKAAFRPLTELLETDATVEVQVSALRALATLDDIRVPGILSARIEGETVPLAVRTAAADALAMCGRTSDVAEHLSRVEAKPAELRTAIYKMAAHHDLHEHLSQIAKGCVDTSEDVRTATYSLLCARLRPCDLAPALLISYRTACVELDDTAITELMFDRNPESRAAIRSFLDTQVEQIVNSNWKLALELALRDRECAARVAAHVELNIAGDGLMRARWPVAALALALPCAGAVAQIQILIQAKQGDDLGKLWRRITTSDCSSDCFDVLISRSDYCEMYNDGPSHARSAESMTEESAHCAWRILAKLPTDALVGMYQLLDAVHVQNRIFMELVKRRDDADAQAFVGLICVQHDESVSVDSDEVSEDIGVIVENVMKSLQQVHYGPRRRIFNLASTLAIRPEGKKLLHWFQRKNIETALVQGARFDVGAEPTCLPIPSADYFWLVAQKIAGADGRMRMLDSGTAEWVMQCCRDYVCECGNSWKTEKGFAKELLMASTDAASYVGAAEDEARHLSRDSAGLACSGGYVAYLHSMTRCLRIISAAGDKRALAVMEMLATARGWERCSGIALIMSDSDWKWERDFRLEAVRGLVQADASRGCRCLRKLLEVPITARFGHYGESWVFQWHASQIVPDTSDIGLMHLLESKLEEVQSGIEGESSGAAFAFAEQIGRMDGGIFFRILMTHFDLDKIGDQLRGCRMCWGTAPIPAKAVMPYASMFRGLVRRETLPEELLSLVSDAARTWTSVETVQFGFAAEWWEIAGLAFSATDFWADGSDSQTGWRGVQTRFAALDGSAKLSLLSTLKGVENSDVCKFLLTVVDDADAAVRAEATAVLAGVERRRLVNISGSVVSGVVAEIV